MNSRISGSKTISECYPMTPCFSSNIQEASANPNNYVAILKAIWHIMASRDARLVSLNI